MADASSQAAAQEQLNLRVLQRSDPGISRIVWVATHVCLYRFDEQARAWAKKGVEGTLFVVERSSSPIYRLFVLNRVGMENYTQVCLDIAKSCPGNTPVSAGWKPHLSPARIQPTGTWKP
eukprot:TRINITY_DN1107_c1_g2_i2.p1 TRINITY_DN1107_c1_g2~~TRINITY_DN1107_c1_g2_i2.p1  ORF type:complete len:120 (-),score=4.35 TRINITY_DN1107_c1_g2_i2:925-1284(-)